MHEATTRVRMILSSLEVMTRFRNAIMQYSNELPKGITINHLMEDFIDIALHYVKQFIDLTCDEANQRIYLNPYVRADYSTSAMYEDAFFSDLSNYVDESSYMGHNEYAKYALSSQATILIPELVYEIMTAFSKTPEGYYYLNATAQSTTLITIVDFKAHRMNNCLDVFVEMELL